MVTRAALEPEVLAEELRASPVSVVAAPLSSFTPRGTQNATLPIVVAHGMGDSCFNPGMKSITKAAGARVGVYSTCVPTASNWVTDTIGGFLKNMDASVDFFAKRVKADPKLAGGFNAFGLSQGNNVIRGYIAKYNDPPVQTFMSICGINAGVGAFPMCSPAIPVVGGVCKVFTEVLGDLAYNSLVQSILFQANYFRDPTKLKDASYLAHSQLARWNGETGADMCARRAPLPRPRHHTYQRRRQTLHGRRRSAEKANWAKTSKFVWVEGTEDTVVWPREGEQWGAVTASYPRSTVVEPYKETTWFRNDTFGLRTADEAGKNFFESFRGQHIRFTETELYGWIDKYFV